MTATASNSHGTCPFGISFNILMLMSYEDTITNIKFHKKKIKG
jgi:hypothetical protein